MSAVLSPIGNATQFFTNQGVILPGGLLYTYLAGTTTLYPTWQNQAQTVQNPNPIVLNSAGRVPQEVWLLNGQAYKFVLTDSAGNTLGTWDNVPGINVTNAILSEWQPGVTATYISPTSFSVTGNLVSVYQPKRRVQYTTSLGTFYGYIVSSTYDGVSTTSIVIAPDSSPMDSTVTAVNYGFMSAVNTSIPNLYVTTTTSNTYTGATNDFTASSILVASPSPSDNSNLVPNTAWVDALVNGIAASGVPVPAWVSGNTYLLGNMVYSPITFVTYRHQTATSASTIDPSADGTNWFPLNVSTNYLSINRAIRYTRRNFAGSNP